MSLRTTPWYYVFPNQLVKGHLGFGAAAGRVVGTGGNLPGEIADWYEAAAKEGQNGGSALDRDAAVFNAMTAVADSGMPGVFEVNHVSVQGRRTRFKMTVLETPTRGVVAFDGTDFYIAPTRAQVALMVERNTVRDGDEKTAYGSRSEITRYYELGHGYVVQLRLGVRGMVRFGRLMHDGTFTAMRTVTGDPLFLYVKSLAEHEEACADARIGLGEPCYRAVARHSAALLWKSAEITMEKYLRGYAPVIDSHGLLLGRRVEFKYGSIVPALGGFRGRRRRSRRAR